MKERDKICRKRRGREIFADFFERERERGREVTGDFLLLLLVAGGGNILARDGWGCTGNQDSFSCSGIRRLTEATYPTVLILDLGRVENPGRGKSRIFDPSTRGI